MHKAITIYKRVTYITRAYLIVAICYQLLIFTVVRICRGERDNSIHDILVEFGDVALPIYDRDDSPSRDFAKPFANHFSARDYSERIVPFVFSILRHWEGLGGSPRRNSCLDIIRGIRMVLWLAIN